MTWPIRIPTVADAETLANLHIATWRETYDALPEASFSAAALDARREFWNDILADPDPAFTVRAAYSGDEIVGFAGSGPARESGAPRDLQLFMLYVSQSHHGTGAGQALLDAVLGERASFLWVAASSVRARSFYRRNGFTADGLTRAEPAVGVTSERWVR